MKNREKNQKHLSGGKGALVAAALVLALIVTILLWISGIVKPVSDLSVVGDETDCEIKTPFINRGIVVGQTFVSPTNELAAIELWSCAEQDSEPGMLYTELWDVAADKCLYTWETDMTPYAFSANRILLELDDPIKGAEGKTFALKVYANAPEEDSISLWKTSHGSGEEPVTVNGVHIAGQLSMAVYTIESSSMNLLYVFAICAAVFGALLLLVPYAQRNAAGHSTFIKRENRDKRLREALFGEALLLLFAFLWLRLGNLDILRAASVHMPVAAFWILTFSMIWWTAVYWDDMQRHPETIFLFAVLGCGLVYFFATPFAIPISWDEAIHFDRTVSLAHVFSGKASLAERWVRMGPVIAGDYFDVESVYKRQSVLQNLYVSGTKTGVNPGYLNSLSEICYAPAALFLLIGQLLPLSYLQMYAFGEIGNLLLYVVLTYFAVRKVRSGKMIVATSALVVVSVFQAAHYTYDSWLTAFFIYGFACFIAAMQEDRVLTTRDQVLMIGAFVLGNCAKACYFPIMAVLLWLPEDKFSDADHCIRFRSAVLSSMTALALTIVLGMKLPQTVVHLAVEFFVLYWPVLWVWRWMHKRRMSTRVLLILVFFVLLAAGGLFMLYRVVPRIMNVGDARGGDVNAPAQLLNILQHPLRCGRIMVEYLVTKLFYFGEEKSWLMNFNNIENLPKPMIWRFFPPALLALVAVTDKSELDRWERRGWVRWTTVALGLLICLLITMILYVDFTPYGLSEVKGVQARYLLPLFYPFLAVIGSASIRNEMSRTAYNSMCLGSAVFILLFGIWETAISSYSWMV